MTPADCPQVHAFVAAPRLPRMEVRCRCGHTVRHRCHPRVEHTPVKGRCEVFGRHVCPMS